MMSTDFDFDAWLLTGFNGIALENRTLMLASPSLTEAIKDIIASETAEKEGRFCRKPGEQKDYFKPLTKREFQRANRLPGY